MKSYEPINEEIVKSFIKGDQQAFETIYSTYQKYVFRLAYQFFTNEETAKDMVQETFLKAFRFRKQLKNPKVIIVWLNRICYSCCLDTYRKNKVDSTGHSDDATSERIEFLEANQEDLAKQLHQKEAKELIIEAIEELRPEYKTIAYLRFFEELKHKEIAEITGMEMNAVGINIKRVKDLIAQKLKEKGFSNNACLSIVATPFLIDFYKEFVTNMPSLSEADAITIQNKTKKQKSNHNYDFKLAYSVIAASTLLTGGVVIYNNPNLKNMITPIEEAIVAPGENATIRHVEYNKELTNMPIKVKVETSDKNYDQILINKKETLTIEENGDYTIDLIRNEEVIDSQFIKITNIDRDVPEVISQVFDGDKVVLTIEDIDSGINYSDIQLFENGVENTVIQIDKENAKITINQDISKNNILKIPDLAGNVLNVNIKFIEKKL